MPPDASDTRQKLLDAAARAFAEDGVFNASLIADRETSRCYVLTQVKNGKFVRVTPTKKGTFDCKPRNRLEIKLDLITE